MRWLLPILLASCGRPAGPLLGKDVAPPGFAPARVGMTKAEALAANPELRENKLGDIVYLRRELAHDVELDVFLDNTGRLRSVKLEFQHEPDCDRLAIEAWGAATQWQRRIPERSVPSWSGRWHAWVDRDPPLCTIEFLELAGGPSCAEVAPRAAHYGESDFVDRTDAMRARFAKRIVAICEADRWPRLSRECLAASEKDVTECIDRIDNEGYMPVRAALADSKSD